MRGAVDGADRGKSHRFVRLGYREKQSAGGGAAPPRGFLGQDKRMVGGKIHRNPNIAVKHERRIVDRHRRRYIGGSATAQGVG